MKLTLSTPSRLHLGFFDVAGEGERAYGGFGVALKSPRLAVMASKADDVRVSGDIGGVFASYARKFIKDFNVSGGVELSVAESIPRHVGLGSGTAAALTVGTLMSKLYGIDASPRDIAEKLGRGRVSGVGVGVFSGGGLVADGGHKRGDESPPPIISSKNFPGEWRFIVAVPEAGEGLSGETERKAMGRVSTPVSTSKRLSSMFLTKVLPALEDNDVSSFGRALTEIDVLVGGAFKSVQGGLYSRKESADLIDFMQSSGVYGAGQSSWGPAVYGLVDGANSSLFDDVRRFMQEKDTAGGVYLSGADNRGAVLEESCGEQVKQQKLPKR